MKLLILICVALFQSYSFAQNNNLAPGAPGKDAQWESAGKTGVGTSTTLESKVWFTLHGGVMTEVYYPTVDVANVRLLQFIVVDSRGKVETERDDAVHSFSSFNRRDAERARGRRRENFLEKYSAFILCALCVSAVKSLLDYLNL